MHYTSPLHLLPGKLQTIPTKTELKKLKKELLLRFELTGDTTITLGERAVDKQSLLDAFHRFEADPAFHFELWKYKSLLGLLENGALHFLDDWESYHFDFDTEFWTKVRPFFVGALSKIITQAVSSGGFKGFNTLKHIYSSDFPWPPGFQEEAYAGAFQWFSHFNKRTYQLVESPFIDDKERTIDPRIGDYIREGILHWYRVLPSSFNSLLYEYAGHAHLLLYHVINPNYRQLGKLDKKTLEITIAAAGICWQVLKDKDAAHNKKVLEQVLKDQARPLTRAIPLAFIIGVTLLITSLISGVLNKKRSPDIIDLLDKNRFNILDGVKVDTKLIYDTWKHTYKTETLDSIGAPLAQIQASLIIHYDHTGKAIYQLRRDAEMLCSVERPFEWKRSAGIMDKYGWSYRLTYTDDSTSYTPCLDLIKQSGGGHSKFRIVSSLIQRPRETVILSSLNLSYGHQSAILRRNLTELYYASNPIDTSKANRFLMTQ